MTRDAGVENFLVVSEFFAREARSFKDRAQEAKAASNTQDAAKAAAEKDSKPRFETIIQLSQNSLKRLNGKISVSELTGFNLQEGTLCSSAAASIEF